MITVFPAVAGGKLNDREFAPNGDVTVAERVANLHAPMFTPVTWKALFPEQPFTRSVSSRGPSFCRRIQKRIMFPSSTPAETVCPWPVGLCTLSPTHGCHGAFRHVFVAPHSLIQASGPWLELARDVPRKVIDVRMAIDSTSERRSAVWPWS